ncbi:MAG: hypothetical protein ACRC7N_20465 [Clostridium sp.]
MTKLTKYFFILIVLLTVGVTITGLYLTGKVTDIDYDYVMDNNHSYILNNNGLLEDREYYESEDIYHNTDLIVSGKPTGVERVLQGSILKEFKVDKKYKGACDEYIYVHEEVFLNVKNDYKNKEDDIDGYFIIYNGVIPMKENKDYILLLSEENFNEKLKFIDKQNSSYTISDKFIGKIPLKLNSEDYKIDILDRSSELMCVDYFEREQIFYSDEVFSHYIKLREDLLRKIGL